MSTVTISPNMNLTVPTVGQELAPTWAQDLNNSLSIIDAHNHASGSGVQINPDGININADLTWNTVNNATDIRSVRFSPQSSALSGASDLGCLYEAGVDLYYNDGAGNQIRITQSGSVTGAAGTITGLPSGTASAAYASSSGTFVFHQATSTAANMDVASVAIRYPGSYPTPSGNYIQLQAPTSLSTGYALTLMPTLPVSNNTFMTVSTAGQIATSVNVDNSTIDLAVSGGNLLLEVAAGGITATQIANGTITRPKLAALGQQISSSCGTFASSSTSFVAVTNLNVTITTTGRPVFIGLQGMNPADLSNQSLYSLVGPSDLKLVRGGTDVVVYKMDESSSILSTPPSVLLIDTPGAGTYTYTVYVKVDGGGGTLIFQNYVLVAYEL